MNLLDYINIASGVIAVASAVTAATPTPKDDGVIKGIYSVVDLLALNFGYRKK